MTHHGLTGKDAVTFMNFVFTAQGRTLECPHVETTRGDPIWIAKWEQQIKDYVSYHDPWGLLTMRPDGDIMLFDATDDGIRQCAEWGVVVAMLFPQPGWDRW